MKGPLYTLKPTAIYFYRCAFCTKFVQLCKICKDRLLFVFLYLKVFAIKRQQLNIHLVYNDNSFMICANIFI